MSLETALIAKEQAGTSLQEGKKAPKKKAAKPKTGALREKWAIVKRQGGVKRVYVEVDKRDEPKQTVQYTGARARADGKKRKRILARFTKNIRAETYAFNPANIF